MRASVVGGALCLLAWVGGAWAQEGTTEPPKPLPPLEIAQPVDTESCLKLLERIVDYAEAADMLDDQVEMSEAELERMEDACNDKRFDEAFAAAKAVTTMVEANK